MQYNITYRKKDKGIQFIISYKDNTGKWRQKSKQGFKKQSLAKIAADKMLDDLKNKMTDDLNVEYENITFKGFKDMYLTHLKLYKEHNTILLYENALKHFKTLNDINLIDIKQLHIQNCVDEMIKKKLAHSTIDNYLARIKVIFNAAINPYKIISSSPVNYISIKIDKESPNKKALTKSEFERLINKTTNPKYKIMFLLAGSCGLRIGEIVGLTWDCINFKTATLTINKQWKNISPNKSGFGELKSKNSYRDIPIPPTTLKALKEFNISFPIDINNRVVPYKRIQGLSWLLKRYFKNRGFDITIHELRHTYATLLISKGVDWKTSAKLLGHTVEQTMHTYSHVNNDMFNNAKNIINNMF